MTKGAYVLITYNEEDNNEIRIGRLGKIQFQKGYYCYVGSALGKPKTSVCLENRVRRHINSSFVPNGDENRPKKHWHIDYVLANPHITIIKLLLIPCSVKIECEVAERLNMRSEGLVNGFGCSDCECDSHLFYFKHMPIIIE
ncbi:MAG: DUF123 domain-containing protein [Candidatus Lokiarchaeota archaeon]|nr:DUF123 domain-containing protein [Candidatus Lokiarchaeota archaeon]